MSHEHKPQKGWPKPDSWVCAECRKAATGWHQAPGIAVFHCAEHEDLLCDLLMDHLGYEGLDGRSGLERFGRGRLLWSNLRSPFWKLYYLSSPRWRKIHRNSRDIAAKLAERDWHGPEGLSERIGQATP